MMTITFDADNSNITTIKNVLKALGAKKIRVHETPDKVKFTKEEFDKMLEESSKKKHKGVSLKTEQDVEDFFKSL